MAECIAYTPIYGPVISDPAWDTGYSTGVFESGDFYYAFSSSTTVQGAVAGVNDQDITEHFSDIDYGFAFAGGRVRAIEGGSYVGPDWSNYNDDDLFIIMRLGTTIYYLRGFTYNYDTEVYYDDALPGVPLPGAIMWASTAPSYGAMQVDIAIFGIGDTVCLLDSGVSWSEDTSLNTASLTGELDFTVVGAGGFGEFSALFVGELPFAISASGSAEEGVAAGELRFDLLFGDIERTSLTGELGFTGSGIMSAYNDVMYRSASLGGYMRFTGYASGEPYTPTGVTGEFPIVLAGASSEFIDLVYNAGVDGTITFDIAAVGTPTGSGIQSGAAGELTFNIQGAGTEGTTETDAALVAELPFIGVITGSAYPDNKTITAVLDGELDFTMLGVGGALYTNYFNILLPELGDAPLLEQFDADILEEIIVSMEVQARLVLLIKEFIRITTTPSTFSQLSVYITDSAEAVATAIPTFSLYIAEQFDVDSTLTVTQVMELAEEVLAAGVVQNVYQGVVAILSAMLVSDNKITGGSAAGSTAGVSVQDFGPPSVEFTFTGYWKKGTEIQLGYTTDAGPGYISYTFEFPQDGVGAMTLFAVALDAQPLVNATFDGTSVTMTAQAPATTVNL